MTDPRRDQNPQLSTAELAAAGERPMTRDEIDRGATGGGGVERDVTPPRAANVDATAGGHPSLFGDEEAADFRARWGEIQTAFVDEPRQAVEQADALVATAIKRLAEIFADERAALEQQWARGGDVSTEDLRVALRRYRGFFDRLLSV